MKIYSNIFERLKNPKRLGYRTRYDIDNIFVDPLALYKTRVIKNSIYNYRHIEIQVIFRICIRSLMFNADLKSVRLYRYGPPTALLRSPYPYVPTIPCYRFMEYLYNIKHCPKLGRLNAIKTQRKLKGILRNIFRKTK